MNVIGKAAARKGGGLFAARGLPIAALFLTACDAGGGDVPSGGLTAGEAAQLERAAERIDARAPSPFEEDAAALEADVRDRLAAEQPAQAR